MTVMKDVNEIRYPVGDFVVDPVITAEKRERWMIAGFRCAKTL